MRLKNKVAIITGGAHGMGEAEARLFAAEGAKVIVADILASDAETVAADIRANDGEATAAKIDVTNEAEWIDLIAKAMVTYGRLDILVNIAGISGSSVGDHNGLEGWHRIIAVNQTSVFLGTKLAVEQMAKTGGGSIVNISSIMGFVGSTSGHPAYHVSKGAVRIYSKAAAVRYGPSGVRVNTVHPGYIDGGFIAQYPGSSLTPPAFRPCAGQRNKWFRTRRGSSAPTTIRRPSSLRCSNKNLRRRACGLRRVRRRRVRSRP